MGSAKSRPNLAASDDGEKACAPEQPVMQKYKYDYLENFRRSSMKTIFFSFLVGTFLLFAGHIYAEDRIIDKTKTINSEEEKLLITQCTQVWQHYKAALSRGNIEEALEYVSDNSKEGFRAALQYQRRSVHLGEITRLDNIKNNVAQFKMLVKFKLISDDDIPPGYSVGDTMESEGYVNFTRDSSGNWKIDFYS
jgi:hypothetical protein